MTHRWRSVLPLAVVLIAPTGAGVSRAEASPPQYISAVADIDEVQLAASEGGATVAAWAQHRHGAYQVQVAVRPSGAATFNPRQTVWASSDVSPYQLHVATNPAGDVVVTWLRWNVGTGSIVVVAAVRRAGATRFGPVQQLSHSPHSHDPRVAVDGAGSATVAWQVDDSFLTSHMQLAILPAGRSTFSPRRTITTAGDPLGSPTVAAGPTGTVVAWQQHDLPGTSTRWTSRIYLTTKPAGATQFGDSGRPLSPSGHTTFAPLVALDAAGKITLAWGQGDGQRDGLQTMQGSMLSGVFGPRQTIAPITQNVMRLALSVGPRGDAALAWQDKRGLMTAFRNFASDRFDTPRRLSRGHVRGGVGMSWLYGGIHLATNATGDTVIAWIPSSGNLGLRMARHAGGAASFGPVHTLPSDPLMGDVATSGAGDATVLWVIGLARDGRRARLAAQQFSMPALTSSTTEPAQR